MIRTRLSQSILMTAMLLAVLAMVGCQPKAITVPNAVGQTEASARAAFTGAGLTMGTVTQAFSETVPADLVISQDPAAGTLLPPGAAVNVVVSKGPDRRAVPDVVGIMQSAAGSAITGVGLAVGTVTQAFSETVPADQVISQDPAAGSLLPPGATINMVVSKGPDRRAVPDVVGIAQSAAGSAITGVGLAVGTVTHTFSETVPADQVISQDPQKGTLLPPGAAVNLVVSKGPAGARFESGSETAEVSMIVGETGAVLTPPAHSPLAGVVVNIPAGALPGDIPVTLASNTGTLHIAQGQASGTVIALHTPSVNSFAQPVEITYTYATGKADGALPVPYYVDDSGNLHLLTITNLNIEEGTVTFQTFHASIFTWILDLLDITATADSYNTGFVPLISGFQVVNRGTTVNRDGECFGMSSFSLWYYQNHLAEGALYPRFMDAIGGSGLTGQNIIATRAFNSIAQQWNTYIPTITAQQNLTENQQMRVVRNALVNTENPVLIYLYHNNTHEAGAHSVLAYGYSGNANPNTYVDFSVYNSNNPGDANQNIRFNTTTDAWSTYAGYDGIVYNGDGGLNLTEPYSYILDDANAGFHSSSDAVINITSHRDGEDVSSRTISLVGTIENGQVAVTELKVFVNSVEFRIPVDFNGAFTQEIPIQVGPNHLSFETRGYDGAGELILVNNNMTSEDFQLIGVADTAAILVTLTWDKNDTDVDTYVIDPTGDYSCYYNMTTVDGGQLDVDDTDGYGPEHWTLTYQATVRWDEDYRVRVHYYSDHGNGPTNYTVKIMLYEGTDRQIETSYRGNLASWNAGNNSPTGTGPDWADIATVRPTQSKASIVDQVTFAPCLMETPRVTVPIPPEADRAKTP